MQDNYFFREPSTQKQMLDILFIYSKLNPDTGYRQGMHELLAPILWVIECDAIEVLRDSTVQDDGHQLMMTALDHEYIEHDAFSLFCAVMQTAKSFYETGENKDSTPIVSRCRRIQEDVLEMIDPELANHLQVIGVLPQVYLMYVRLIGLTF
jgi:TBC1 domain family member 5